MNNIPSMFMNLFANPRDTRQQVNEFAKNLNCDPKQKVQELVNSGQMSQSQYNALSNIANMLIKQM